ncbi:MAG: hypothetical protein CL521_04750 [Actinobacteria bacterium]|nr:hypothetical protein [Actinomycetota bacterium]
MSKPKKGKRFVYSLASLLKVREIREKQEQDKLIEAERRLREEQQKEKEMKAHQAAQYSELQQMLGETDELPDMNYIKLRKLYIEKVKEQVIEQEKVTQEADKAKDDQREKLTEAAKNKKIIEKDKEKTRIEWKKLMDKEDGKFLDEIATIGFESKRRQAEEDEKRADLRRNESADVEEDGAGIS